MLGSGPARGSLGQPDQHCECAALRAGILVNLSLNPPNLPPRNLGHPCKLTSLSSAQRQVPQSQARQHIMHHLMSDCAHSASSFGSSVPLQLPRALLGGTSGVSQQQGALPMGDSQQRGATHHPGQILDAPKLLASL